MPNWVMNEIFVDSDEDYVKLLNATSSISPAKLSYGNILHRPMINYMDLNKIVPMPDTVYQGSLGKDEEYIYGTDNCWYDWSLNNWGTKWNTNPDDVYLGDKSIIFMTPWSAVPRVIGILSQQTGLNIGYKYADEDAGMNTGNFRFENGRIANMEYHNDNYKALQNYLDLWGNDDGHLKIIVNRNGYKLRYLESPVSRCYHEEGDFYEL